MQCPPRGASRSLNEQSAMDFRLQILALIYRLHINTEYLAWSNRARELFHAVHGLTAVGREKARCAPVGEKVFGLL